MLSDTKAADAQSAARDGRALELAERRQLTVLFCDIVGSTRHTASMDPEAWREVLQTYHRLCDEVVRPLHGHIAQYLGDGVLVYFGYPRALEDAARRAVRAALQLAREVARNPIRVSLPPASPIRVDLQVRLGVHTGAVVVDRFGGDNPQHLAVGEVLNMASRIQDAAEPGGVVVSDATFRLTRGFFETQALPVRHVKGYADPVLLYRALGETDARDRLDIANASPGGLTPFMDHTREISRLHLLWEEAKRGTGPVALVSGEAGMGKSRHVQYLQESLAHEIEALIECRCSPYYETTAMYPLIEAVERWLELNADLSARDKLDRIERALDGFPRLGRAAVPLLAAFLSVPLDGRHAEPELAPAKLRQASFELLADLLQALAPGLFVVEDLHWADPSTLEFLGYLIERAPIPGLLIVLTHRPDFRGAWESPRVVSIPIERLPREDAESVVRYVAGEHVIPLELVPQLLSKAEGNPLFVEEVTKAVIDVTGKAIPSERGYRVLPATLIPATVQDPLMARLDQLGRSKRVAQLAAILGREFTFRELHAVCGTDETALRADLQRLIETGMVFRHGQAPGETFFFKHALIRDAAYGSLLQQTRRRYHERIADTLSARFPETAEAKPELLAQHYEQAGRADKAAAFWGAAGQRAISRSAFAEANAAFTRGLRQLAQQPASAQRDQLEIELQIGHGVALISTAGFSAPEVDAAYSRARELCERYGDIPLRVLYGIWVFQFVRGHVEATSMLMRHFDRVVREAPGTREALLSASCLVVRHFWWGDFEQARRYATEAHAIVEAWSDPRAESRDLLRELAYEGPLYPLVQLAWCELYAGRPSRSKAAIDRSFELAAQIDQPYTTAMVHAYACALAHDLRDPEAALPAAERAIEVASEHGFPFWLAAGLFAKGWALCELGDEASGLPALQAGLDLYRSMGVLVSFPYYASYGVEQHLRAGRLEAGCSEVDELLALTATNVGRGYVPELLRLKSELQSAAGDAQGAEQSAREALRTARTQAVPLFELRAAVRLATLLEARGQPAQAREVLQGALAQMPEDATRLREVDLARDHADRLKASVEG